MAAAAGPQALATLAGRGPSYIVSFLIVACHATFLTSQLSGCWQTFDSQDLNGAGIFRIVLHADINDLAINGLAAFFLPNCEQFLSPAPPPPPSPPPLPPPPSSPPSPPPPPYGEYYMYYEYHYDDTARAPRRGPSPYEVRAASMKLWRQHVEEERCDFSRERPPGAVELDIDKTICTALRCGEFSLAQPLFQFSYVFSLYDLYMTNRTRTPDGELHPTDVYHGPGACGVDGVCPEGSSIVFPGQLGAILLFAASFVWPHVKLALLHYFFYTPLPTATRRNGNYWLAFFGKWSFVDVLVMISLLGVLDLNVRDMEIDVDSIAFSGLHTIVSSQLRLEGQLAMYFFCFAVIFSLCIGVLIETLDDKAREKVHARKDVRAAPIETCVEIETKVKQIATHGMHLFLVATTLTLVLAALRAPLMRRVVSGSISELLADFGQNLNESYSLLELARLSARAGGWDILMSATFWIFVVVGPIARSVSQLISLTLPLPLEWQRSVHAVSRHISVFYALEVMVVAVPLLSQVISNLANGLLTEGTFSPCAGLNEQFGGPCLAIAVEPESGYWLMCAAVALYLVCGFDGSPTHKYVHRILYPGDVPPPTCTSRRAPHTEIVLV